MPTVTIKTIIIDVKSTPKVLILMKICMSRRLVRMNKYAKTIIQVYEYEKLVKSRSKFTVLLLRQTTRMIGYKN